MADYTPPAGDDVDFTFSITMQQPLTGTLPLLNGVVMLMVIIEWKWAVLVLTLVT